MFLPKDRLTSVYIENCLDCSDQLRLYWAALAWTWCRPGELGLKVWKKKNSSVLEKLYLILDLSGRTKKHL